jgi:general secretion pathway protein D
MPAPAINPRRAAAKMKPPSPRLRRALFLAGIVMLAAGSLRAQNNSPARPSNGSTSGSTNTTGSTGSGGAASTSASLASPTRQYRNFTQLGDALVQTDPETRSLIVVADDETQKEIAQVIANLDRPKAQVLIKVLFAQVELDNDTDIGVEGSYNLNIGAPPISQLLSATTNATTGTTTTSPTVTTTTTRNTTQVNGSTQTVTTTSQPYPVAGTGTATAQTLFGLSNETSGGFFTVNTKAATATLYALATKGKVTVLSRPSILARNNQEAVIVVGQEIPLITNSQITDTGQTINTVSYQDVGIILRVTPFITTHRSIEMIVSPQISSLSSQTIAISPTVNAPVINKTAAETVVVTPDSQTVVIGGMMQKQKTTTLSKVPFLGDIPLLGYAFRHNIKSDQKTELLIFLTPYIVNGTDGLEDLSKFDVSRTDLPQTALPPEDVNDYLENDMKLFPTPTPKPSPTPAAVRKATPVGK